MKTLEERYSPEHVAAIRDHALYLKLLERAKLEAYARTGEADRDKK